jgi:hypothetical protein
MIVLIIPLPMWMPNSGSNPVPIKGTDNSYCDIGDETKPAACHKLPCQPPRNKANQ